MGMTIKKQLCLLSSSVIPAEAGIRNMASISALLLVHLRRRAEGSGFLRCSEIEKETPEAYYFETDTVAVATLDGSLSEAARRVTFAVGELAAS